MEPVRKVMAIAGVFLMAIGGCSKDATKTVRIDQHVFNIPREYLLEATIPWLPPSQHDGLMFYVYPEAPLSYRNIVGMESTAKLCRGRTFSDAAPIDSACRRAAQKETKEQEGELEKFHRHDDSTQWEYRLKGDESWGGVVVMCSAMGDGNGLCDSFGIYDDLIYTVGLRDSQITQLPLIHRKVRELLSSWEKPTH